MVYVANGQIDWDYDGQIVSVVPRHLSFTWPWQTHGAMGARMPACALYWIVLPLARAYKQPPRTVHYHPSFHIPPAEERHSIALLRAVATPVVPASPLLRALFPELINELRTHGMRDALRLRALILLLLSEVTRAAGSAPTTLPDPAAQRVRIFVESLGKRCGEPWTLQSMAAACDLGRSRFTALVKEISGDSPIQYLNRVRVAEAHRQLLTSHSSVTEIAFACGFSSSQYFSTVFRQFYEMAPRELRHSQP